MPRQSLNIFGIGQRNALLDLLKIECCSANLDLIGYDASPNCPAKQAVDPYFYTVPYAYSPQYLEAVWGLLEENNSLGHFSIIGPEILPLGQLEMQYPQSPSTLLNAAYTTALICEDKWVLYETLINSSIQAMPTNTKPIFDFSFICKDRSGSSASGFRVFAKPTDSAELLERDRVIYQPYCDGAHYCVDAYYSIREGRLIDFCAKKVLHKSKGESYTLRSECPLQFVELLHGIADILPMRGIVNFDIYKYDGKYVVMDINCRIGGNYPASHSFGCDLLKPMLDDLLGKELAIPSFGNYSTNQTISKYLAFTQAQPVI